MKRRLTFTAPTIRGLLEIEAEGRFAVWHDNVTHALATYLAGQPGRMGCVGGRALVAGGLIPFLGGVPKAYIWMVADRRIRRTDWPDITRMGHALIDEGHSLGYAEIVAHIQPDWPQARRWIRRLGFIETDAPAPFRTAPCNYITCVRGDPQRAVA